MKKIQKFSTTNNNNSARCTSKSRLSQLLHYGKSAIHVDSYVGETEGRLHAQINCHWFDINNIGNQLFTNI